MPKKSRISRAKRKAQSSSSPLAIKEVSLSSQPLPLSSRPESAVKPAITEKEQGDSLLQNYILSDVKRSLVCTALTLSVILILYFSFR